MNIFRNLTNFLNPSFLMMLPGLVIGLTVHEFAHAWVALRYGDPTAQREGRVTLNPLAHIDPMGLICLVLFRFGWGKPVPIHPGYFRKPIEAQIAVGLAGIVANLLTMLIAAILYGIVLAVTPISAYASPVFGTFRSLINGVLIYNAGLAVFNLIPIPPLDGSKVLMFLLPYEYGRHIAEIPQQTGWMILMMLSFAGVTGAIMTPIIGLLMSLMTQISMLIAQFGTMITGVY